MMPKKYIQLTESEKEELEKEARSNPKFRVRRRAQALLLSNRGKDRSTIADLLDVRLDTVSDWLTKWTKIQSDSLYDLPRSGRPSILNSAEKKASLK